jgi:DNA transformation protein and related proteins
MISMGRLSQMPNIGAVMEAKLIEVGITTPEELIAAGSHEAYLRLRLRDPGCCLSCLSGLEGAVRGIRWHSMDAETKAALKAFIKSLDS